MIFWKKTKIWLMLPWLLLDKFVFSRMFSYISLLSFNEKKMSGKLYDDVSNIPIPIKSSLKRISISDIDNKKLKRTLRLTSLFRPWYVYFVRINSSKGVDNNREVIYLSRKPIRTGEKIYTNRISDSDLDKNYLTYRIKRFLRKHSLGRDEFYKIESQLYVMVAKKTLLHDKLREKQKEAYERRKKKVLEKTVYKAIKRGTLFTYSTFLGSFNSDLPLFHKVVESGRTDLVKKMLDATYDENERKELINYKARRTYEGNLPIQYAETEEMKELLNNYGK
jgi:hypothetical protein